MSTYLILDGTKSGAANGTIGAEIDPAGIVVWSEVGTPSECCVRSNGEQSRRFRSVRLLTVHMHTETGHHACTWGVQWQMSLVRGRAGSVAIETESNLKLNEQYCALNLTIWPFGALEYFLHYCLGLLVYIYAGNAITIRWQRKFIGVMLRRLDHSCMQAICDIWGAYSLQSPWVEAYLLMSTLSSWPQPLRQFTWLITTGGKYCD